MLEDLHTRLSGVVIECLDWSQFILRYDGPGTLFYLDPPYWGCEGDYGDDLFSRRDFAAMASQLSRLEGRFLLSLNDVPEVRDIFGAFTLTPVQTTYTVGKTSETRGNRAELIISNFGW